MTMLFVVLFLLFIVCFFCVLRRCPVCEWPGAELW